MLTDWTLLSIAFVAAWAAIAVIHALWSARDIRHDPAAPDVPEPHAHH